MNPPEYNDTIYYCIMEILICLNIDQMENDTRNAPIFEDIIKFISKTKGLGENLTIPRDATDIFPSEIINNSGKSRFVCNTEAK